MYSSVCVGPVRKPHCWFSHEAAHFDLESKKKSQPQRHLNIDATHKLNIKTSDEFYGVISHKKCLKVFAVHSLSLNTTPPVLYTRASRQTDDRFSVGSFLYQYFHPVSSVIRVPSNQYQRVMFPGSSVAPNQYCSEAERKKCVVLYSLCLCFRYRSDCASTAGSSRNLDLRIICNLKGLCYPCATPLPPPARAQHNYFYSSQR